MTQPTFKFVVPGRATGEIEIGGNAYRFDAQRKYLGQVARVDIEARVTKHKGTSVQSYSWRDAGSFYWPTKNPQKGKIAEAARIVGEALYSLPEFCRPRGKVHWTAKPEGTFNRAQDERLGTDPEAWDEWERRTREAEERKREDGRKELIRDAAIDLYEALREIAPSLSGELGALAYAALDKAEGRHLTEAGYADLMGG